MRQTHRVQRGPDPRGWTPYDLFIPRLRAAPLRYYERLTAAEVVEGLSSLTVDDLGRVKEREMAGKNRVTVLRRIAALEDSPSPRARPRSTSGAASSPSPPAIPAPGAMPAWATPAEPASTAPGYANAANTGPYAQDPARLRQIAEVRQKAMKSIVLWGLAVIAGVVVSVATYANAGPGDRYFVWWGPVVFGIWRVCASASVLFRLRNV
ncbi:MAG TPA: hypothetical protein VM121_03090 [Acidimicrobiales bacterium]|nr:hypothetical protein [Acidimicrobiales bacterium]